MSSTRTAPLVSVQRRIRWLILAVTAAVLLPALMFWWYERDARQRSARLVDFHLASARAAQEAMLALDELELDSISWAAFPSDQERARRTAFLFNTAAREVRVVLQLQRTYQWPDAEASAERLERELAPLQSVFANGSPVDLALSQLAPLALRLKQIRFLHEIEYVAAQRRQDERRRVLAWLLWPLCLLLTGAGVSVSVLAWRDIQRGLLAERRLRDTLAGSEGHLAEAQRLARLGSWTWDIVTGELTWSGVAKEILGYEPDMAGLPARELFVSLVHPDDRPRVQAHLEAIATQDVVPEIEYRLLRRDGEIRFVITRAERALDASGRLVGLKGTVQDVTTRRMAEQSLHLQSAALHAAADAIVITDRAGLIEWVNPAFTRLTGYTAGEALGRSPRDLVKSGKHPAAFFKEFWETILAGGTWHGQIVNRRKDGALYTEAQVVTPIVNESGAITHFVAIKEDVTERLQLEAQLSQALKMETVGQLASGIAHDFNNLLTVINGVSELVLEQVGHDEFTRGLVQQIHGAGERAATLTSQLLAFSRKQILQPRIMNFNTVATGMEGLLGRLLGEDIDIAIVAAPDLGNVKADPGQMEQVITNLAVNARDAMPRGGQLTIETHNLTVDEDYARQHGLSVSPGLYVMLVVSDTGVGMDEATRARLFEPFFTTKRPGKGTGLGLSTVYGIVKQSQGFIWVYSEVGLGTSFRICLPRVTGAVDTQRPEATGEAWSGTETILVVEDNTGVRDVVTRFLERAGYTVLGLATGEEALRLAVRHEEPLHLLLSDVVMPGMSGRHLAERLAQARPGIKVLYMSGYTDDTVVRHGVLNAQVPFLNKPFTAAALLRKVRDVLDS